MDNTAPQHNYQQVKALIKQFAGQANTLVIPRVFIDLTGDHLAALLLSQILYWSDKTANPDGWFYKTADEWHEELGLSNFQVKRAAALLSQFGVETKVRKVKLTPKMHYRIDLQLFTDLFLKFLESQETRNSRNLPLESQETSKSMEVQETSKSYRTEITTEITTESVGGNEKSPTRSPSELALAIAGACKINPKIATRKQREQLNEAYQSLKAIQATPAQVQQRADWWPNDWRAKKENRPPRPMELVEIWEAAAPIRTPNRTQGEEPIKADRRVELSPEERAQKAERLRKIKEETNAKLNGAGK